MEPTNKPTCDPYGVCMDVQAGVEDSLNLRDMLLEQYRIFNNCHCEKTPEKRVNTEFDITLQIN